ncbi:DUF1254 domain-containing protein [Vibrio sp. D404a]|uniref:DUF1254 domain-containing protein n=1 Tax=unclassified Vibrio TaxID=2614977 RepID=UPI002554785E|nr:MULTISPECIES: DUF1254 domain-containing protein [unclassified Vibrio]MDK9736820.1 DUF1254 domain-containing protein [Vibrio sp. D404a]MDK9795762.1 DUF1254 domain-containing protein [Vibrio sp. D449a]
MMNKNRIIKALACAFLVSVPAYALANQTELPAESTFEITRDTLPVEMASLAWLEQDKEQLAQLAYEYAYSIDEAYKYFYQTVIKEEYPLNRFQNIRVLADDTYTAHPTINNDTLHLMGWMDLGAEPVIITIPDHDEDRYWLFHTMNMQHFTDSAFGSPQRGTKGGSFMYAVEGWQGEVPASVDQVIYVEHPLVKMMGRIMDLGGDDSATAQKLMDQWNIRTLSEYLGQKGPKPVEREYPDPQNSNWVERTNFILSEGTMKHHDQRLLQQFDLLGLGNEDYILSDEQLKLIELGEKKGAERIKNAGFDDSRDVLGTREEMTKVASYQHAYGTLMGQWGLPAKHTMYSGDFFDTEGVALDGSKYDYTVTFDAPPLEEGGFWSYTAYSGKTRLMEKNALNRHSRGDRTLTPNKDGSYTITMSSDVEGNEDNPNFLPIPNHPWYAVLRMYTPGEEVRTDKWKSTAFTKVSKSNTH